MQSRVLIVEDESIVALDLQRRLIRLGYEVPRVTASHDQTLRAVAETEPNIVLMDINISGDIDGIDTAKKINLPVIFLTAYSEEKTLQRAKESRPYGYLVKPFSERELHATIQMALERHEVETRLRDREISLAQTCEQLEQGKRALELKSNELHVQKQRFEVTLNSIGDGVITTDTVGNVTYLNPVAEQKTGWTMSEALGLPISQIMVLVDEETRQNTSSPVEVALRTGHVAGMAHNSALLSQRGELFSIEDSTAPMCDHEENIIGMVVVFHDVSDTRRLADEMSYHSTHDALTDLVNRREFEKRLQKALQCQLQGEHQHALAYLDLDQFKIVNDTCGHHAGDELLRQITSLMRLALRSNDTLARLGGDEFGVLLESCPPHIAQNIAEKLKSAIAGFHFHWQGKVFPVTVSIGLVYFGESESPHRTVSDLLRVADSACYAAKDMGRNRVYVVKADDETLNQRHGELNWYTKIYRALEQNHLQLYAQKIVALKEPSPYHEHMEVLLRLIGEDGKVVPPMAFMPAAERYGLMVEIDKWVIHSALAYIAGQEHKEHSLYSINLSGCSLNDEHCLGFILEQLRLNQVPPQCICFEITETVAIANLMKARALMVALKNKGCKFALDDFGSGMSSFAYLKHLPVDYLKIDGCFVKEMESDPVDIALVQAINQIAHVMGIQTIAEFVESQFIFECLRDIGVDYAQGYGIGHPAPIPLRFP